MWICPDALGHIQVTARDARGRKQYRYHPRWRTVRDEAKYGRMLAFGQALPIIRARIEEDLAHRGLSRRRVLAAVIKLLEATLIRVGNEEYARDNGSFGLTTFRDRHASITGWTVQFRFRGKSGKVHEVGIQDRRLSGIVKRCQELPGQELFQYVDGQGRRRAVTSSDVNDYLREVTGQAFTAKDFRTWAGTVLAAWALRDFPAVRTEAEAKKNVVRAVERVAGRLGNTVAICRKSYVHPVVFDAYLDGTLVDTLQQRLDHEVRAGEGHLQREEMAVPRPPPPAAGPARRRGRRRRPEPDAASARSWPCRRRSTRACDGPGSPRGWARAPRCGATSRRVSRCWRRSRCCTASAAPPRSGRRPRRARRASWGSAPARPCPG